MDPQLDANGKQPYYYKDPKKAITTYYEREGGEPEFEYEEKNGRTREFVCRLRLPIESQFGEPIVVEGVGE